VLGIPPTGGPINIGDLKPQYLSGILGRDYQGLIPTIDISSRKVYIPAGSVYEAPVTVTYADREPLRVKLRRDDNIERGYITYKNSDGEDARDEYLKNGFCSFIANSNFCGYMRMDHTIDDYRMNYISYEDMYIPFGNNFTSDDSWVKLQDRISRISLPYEYDTRWFDDGPFDPDGEEGKRSFSLDILFPRGATGKGLVLKTKYDAPDLTSITRRVDDISMIPGTISDKADAVMLVGMSNTTNAIGGHSTYYSIDGKNPGQTGIGTRTSCDFIGRQQYSFFMPIDDSWHYTDGRQKALAEGIIANCSLKKKVDINVFTSNKAYKRTGSYVYKGLNTETNEGQIVSFDGDVFPGIQSHIYTHYAYNNTTTPEWFDECASTQYIYYPAETHVNQCMADHRMAESGQSEIEFQNEPYVSPRTGVKYTKPAYSYNNVYSLGASQIVYDDENDVENVYFYGRICYSDKKVVNEYIDSYLIYKPLNYIDIPDCDSPINFLFAIQNVLYATTTNEIYGIGVGERSLIDANNASGSQLMLGQGDVFQSSFLISNSYGCTRADGTRAYNNRDYCVWYDATSNALLRFNDNTVQNIGKTQFVSKAFTNNRVTYAAIGRHDHTAELLVLTNNFSLVHDDMLDRFVSYRSAPTNALLFTINGSLTYILPNANNVNNAIYQWNRDYYTTYGARGHSITFHANPKAAETVVYDYNILPNTGISDTNDVYTINIGKSTLNQTAQLSFDINRSSRQLREGNYYIPVGRDSANIRIRGLYLTVTLSVQTGTSGTNKWYIPYVKTQYRQSRV
jgi:hypothetical protein